MSTDSVAQDQIKAFVDRIIRLKEEAKAINADIREIYAEAKGNGFDKTVLGKVVNYVEKRATKADELAEGEALFDLYLSAYDSASGKVGTARATHTHETARRAERFRITKFSDGTGKFERFDADGALIEDDDDEPSNMHDLHNAPASDFLAENANNEPQPSAPAPAAQTVAADTSGALTSEAEPEAVASSATIQPETANEAPMAVYGDSAAGRRTPQASLSTFRPEGTTGGTQDVAALSRPSAPIREATGKSVEPSGSAAPLPQVPADFHPDVPQEQLEARMRRTLDMRPECRKPWSCGSANPGLCFSCKKAAAAEQGSEAA